jgi:hypothetical protein
MSSTYPVRALYRKPVDRLYLMPVIPDPGLEHAWPISASA